jgi:hypothetical protein
MFGVIDVKGFGDCASLLGHTKFFHKKWCLGMANMFLKKKKNLQIRSYTCFIKGKMI